MILSGMPDLSIEPRNAAARAAFFSAWGQANMAICGQVQSRRYGAYSAPLSIKMLHAGSGDYYLQHRNLRVDDDCYLVLNAQSYESSFHGEHGATILTLYFRPGLVEEVRDSRCAGWQDALDAGGAVRNADGSYRFAEHLRPHDEWLSPRLLHIRAQLLAGQRCEVWLEEQMIELASILLDAERMAARWAGLIHAEKAATQRELLKRARWAADFIHTHYADALDLQDIASAARLSKFHLTRLFKQTHGQTPHQFLLAKRGAVARRMLAQQTAAKLDEVAQASGFGDRTTMFRQLRRQFGVSAAALRKLDVTA
jgi:AraC-like DNA-binding protein